MQSEPWRWTSKSAWAVNGTMPSASSASRVRQLRVVAPGARLPSRDGPPGAVHGEVEHRATQRDGAVLVRVAVSVTAEPASGLVGDTVSERVGEEVLLGRVGRLVGLPLDVPPP